MWKWFIQPLNVNIPTLSLFHAIGMSMIFAFLTHQVDFSEEKKKIERDDAMLHTLATTVGYGITFGFAWIISCFI
jgi:hypothetical protein